MNQIWKAPQQGVDRRKAFPVLKSAKEMGHRFTDDSPIPNDLFYADWRQQTVAQIDNFNFPGPIFTMSGHQP
ncbi:MAG: hypothetical protein GY820_32340 [Gammaproteobacteria bacterium]|nr:hypothetical protein [Gammaproteobacteria bacterium]